ncbi:UDP-N-acetylglucosamine 2-epimerase [Halovivax ruber XH-70]|uniref:UDP-N-acetylglucosamine 2-epimerase n=1 Tax=Halovivax ruber (strain DSM 18193 / JCM 13892 / XH-70) TaxID=797302 RepID=L0I9X5_HALRX|nr:UDP-N-acetylglucosamine 2-epimerase (non-hydrolyzing) [Halovivax ruber]AGB15628.1 UDP-N-acetylglucosamine 2-epimerase [Halovivax ruber XH-70]
MKVLTVVGARPQFIKAFVVSRALKPEHEEVLVHTGQHYDEELSDVFFDELGMDEPAYNLGVGSGSHGQQTGEMTAELESVMIQESPDVVLLYGDTNSTLAGAIAASKLDVRVAHVEAGLRSHNRDMPEETNRILTDHASDVLFAPSESAVDQLESEGITDSVYNVGDVMYDSLLWARDRARDMSDVLSRLDLIEGKYVLSTVHRAGNTDDPGRLESIVRGLAAAPYPVVLPAHPRTVDRLKAHSLWELATSELQVVDPVGYLDFVRLMDGSVQIATDSGGIQKEAFYLDTPCVTLRDDTEWTETVEAGWNVLVGADQSLIAETLQTPDSPESKPNPYGDGEAGTHIVDVLETLIVDNRAQV